MPNRLGQPRSAVVTVAVAAALAVAGYVGSASGFPTVWSPLPLATTLPIFWFWEAVGEAQSLRWVVDYGIPMLMGPLLLLAWHPRLAVGADDVPRRSFLGLVLLSVLAGAHFVFGWNYGLKYQSQGYVRAVLVLNVTVLLAAWSVLWGAWRRRTFPATLAAHALVVGWLVWIAFPWLGELP